MLTLKAMYNDGQVTFIDPVPFSGQQEILVTFLTSDHDITNFSGDAAQELKTLIRESGLVLTHKELEVLRLARDGYEIREIAKILEISHGSARNHLSSIYAKFHVRNRTEAIKKAVRIGLLDPHESFFD